MAGQQNAASAIWNFFAGKGLSSAVIAGIMGNLQVESSDNPAALNANEGAIGIAQWEGGRRSALQQFAAQHGTTETDLSTQLNFLWQELNTSYPGVLQSIRGMTDPSQVAAEWDAHYEVSAGTSRNQRVSDAQQYYSAFQSSGVAGVAGVSPTTVSGDSGMSGGVGGTLATGGTPLTASQYEQALGALSGIINSVPELKAALAKAIQTQQPVDDFINSIQGTSWYRQHSDAWQQQFALKYSHPGEYNQQLSNTAASVMEQSRSMGVAISQTQATTLAKEALVGAWSAAQIQAHIGALYMGHGPFAQSAQLTQSMQQMAYQYGVPVTSDQVTSWTQKILEGTDTIDGFRQQMMNSASTLFPGLKTQILAGQTVQDVAQPYIATMAQTLEMPSSSITLTDPTIKQALQYATPGTSGGGSSGPAATKPPTTTPPSSLLTGKPGQTKSLGTPSPPSTIAGGSGGAGGASSSEPGLMPLYQFESQLRQDPRWEKTTNAKQEAYSMLHQLGQSFGFAS